MDIFTPAAHAPAATQAQMEAATSNVVFATPAGVQWHPGVAKAWAYCTMSGSTVTLAANYNVSSITDNGVGDFTVNFTTAFSSGGYAAAAGALGDYSTAQGSRGINVNSAAAPTGSAFRIVTTQLTAEDPASRWSIAFLGDQ